MSVSGARPGRRRWLRVVVSRVAVSSAIAGAAGLALHGTAAADVYRTPDEFIRSAFGGHPPTVSTLWPSPVLQQRIRHLLGRPYKQLRIRYWRDGRRTAWVLDEVGKDEEITIGFVLADDAIEHTEVLAFRESRGWEIRFPGFTRQFRGAHLAPGDSLDANIDGITGATLSVGAYRRLAVLALMLHQEAVADVR